MSAVPQDCTKSGVPGSRRMLVPGTLLRMARIALVIACLLTFIQSGVEFFTAESQFESAVERDLQRYGGALRIDPVRMRAARDRYVRTTRVSALVSAGLFALLVILTRWVYRYPLFCTVGGLLLFLGVTIPMAFLTLRGPDVVTILSRNWMSLTWNLGIVVSLTMGVQAALLYQRERTRQVKTLMEKLEVMTME